MPRTLRRVDAPSPTDKRRVNIVSIEERRKRTALIEGLLISGVPMTRIEDQARQLHQMTKSQVGAYIARIRETWAAEEAGNRAHNKAQQQRRLYGHISAAKADKNWPAVAQFEKLLADIQGTREPLEMTVTTTTLTEVTMKVVSGLTPERRGQLLARHRQLLALAAKGEEKAVIETTGTSTD